VSAAATFVVAQIETFPSHIGDIYSSACLSQKLSLLCHIKMFVSQPARVTTFVGHTMWGVHDDPPTSSSRRMLPKFEDFGKQRSVYARGVWGGGEGGHT